MRTFVVIFLVLGLLGGGGILQCCCFGMEEVAGESPREAVPPCHSQPVNESPSHCPMSGGDESDPVHGQPCDCDHTLAPMEKEIEPAAVAVFSPVAFLFLPVTDARSAPVGEDSRFESLRTDAGPPGKFVPIFRSDCALLL